ncbi:unnamed protein product [Merluccius merluccius]
MSENGGRPSSTSSVSSISLLEIKAETSLVLKAFLRQSLALPLADRPGRVGGAYKDHSKYSVQLRSKAKNGFHSQDDEVSSGDEKKKGLKNLIRRTIRRPTKDPSQDPTGSLEKEARPKGGISPAVAHLLPEDDAFSPSSTSEEDDGEQRQRKKQKKKNKLKKQLSELFRRKVVKDTPERPEPRPQRPSKLSIPRNQAPDPLVSPNHPPEFYEEVAERLELIAQTSNSIKRIKSGPLPVQPKPPPPTPPPTVKPTEPVVNKDEVVRQLIQVLSMEADAITSKIQSDPFLRSNLTRLSYPSFAKLLDAFSNSEMAQPPPNPLPAPLPASPTLRRVAVTMEVSRRVVTATGTQRMQGYAERYMENFAPWVKSYGGWENIVHFEEDSEFD